MGWDLVRGGEQVWTQAVFRFLEEEEDGLGRNTGEAQ
jgi:hypothetical protein